MRQITDTLGALKRRGDLYEEQLRACHEKVTMEQNKNEQIEEAKNSAMQRWKVAKGNLRKMRNQNDGLRSKLKDSRNRIRYLEKLLAFEERSGFSTLVSEMQLE